MTATRRAVACYCGLLVLLCVALADGVRAEEERTLSGGWTRLPPYSYLGTLRGTPQWQGLDVELLFEISSRAGYWIDAPEIDWGEHVDEIRRGERDIAAHATPTPERETFAYFSIPYRTGTLVLIVPRGESGSLPATSDIELVESMKRADFRLGIDRHTAHPSEALREFIVDPANRQKIVPVQGRDLLNLLVAGHVDGCLTDRIVAANMIEAAGLDAFVEEHPVAIDEDLHLMFSKASVEPLTVQRFNDAIESVYEDGTYRRLNERYTLPILVRLTLKSNWFAAADIVGTAAFAMSGLLLAFRYNYDVFGALVLASLPAVGGGVIRDLITNRETLSVLASPIYIQIVLVLVIGGYATIRAAMAIRRSRLGSAALGLFEQRRSQVSMMVQVCDAIGLAAFTVTGVAVALGTGAHPLWLWGPILAAITAAGGGILRDVVRSDPDIPALKGQLYPEIAVVWGLVLSIYFEMSAHTLNADALALGVAVTFIGAFATRMLAIHFGLRSPRFSF